jgi:hypothetical protein
LSTVVPGATSSVMLSTVTVNVDFFISSDIF